MAVQFSDIQHDGGTHEVSVETEGDQCVIKFGGSFTLRVDEVNLSKLREMIHIAVRDLTIERRDTSGIQSVAEIEKLAERLDQETNTEKEQKRTDQQTHDVWLPNDPVNW